MEYFNIGQSRMPSSHMPSTSCKQKIVNYLFRYPGREQISLQVSTLSDKALLFSRLFSFLLLSAVYVWCMIIVQRSLFENVQYLTMIGYFTTWLYFTLTIQDLLLNSDKQIKSKHLKWYAEIAYEISFCVQVPITIVFWAFLFQILLNIEGVTTEIVVINGFLHAAPMVCLTVDFVLNLFAFPINHLPLIILFDVFYFVINLVYSITVRPIYGPINWVSVISYVITTASVVLTIFFHYFGRLVYRKWKQPNQNHHLSESLLSQNTIESNKTNIGQVEPTKNTPFNISYNL